MANSEDKVIEIEICLKIETGNTIAGTFTNPADAINFVYKYVNNPEEILKRITPRKTQADKEDDL